MAVLHKLITRVVIATGTGVQVFWVFTAMFTLVDPTSQVKAAAIISAGVVRSP